MPLVLLSGFVLGRDQVSSYQRSCSHTHWSSLMLVYLVTGKTRYDSNRHNKNDLFAATNPAYGMHEHVSTVQDVTTSSVAPVYESIDTT